MHFYDQEASYRGYLALRGNADGMGGWKVTDTLGLPWIDLPERLRADLMTWRWLADIAERIASKEKKAESAKGDPGD